MKSGRNDPCGCGSGKKFKHCCEAKVVSHASRPSSAEISQLIALYESGRYIELENRARISVSQFPDFGFGWKLLGGALQMQGKNALPTLQRAAELMPDDADAYYNLGVALKGWGLFDDAVKSYRRALKINPEYAEAHSNLGNVFKELGQLDDAVDSYRRALQIKPNSAETHNSLGAALRDIGQTDEALASYSRALTLKPDYASAYYNMGNLLKELGRFDEAVGSFRRAVKFNPRLADAHNNLGATLQLLGQLNDAVACYRSAIIIAPNFSKAYSNLGIVLHELDQPIGAEECYRRALEIDSGCIEAMIGIGQLCMEKGDLAGAEEQLLGVLEINPDNLDARIHLAQAKKTRVGDENFAALLAADTAAQNGISPVPDKQAISLQFALGKCFDDIGDYDQAFPHFIKGNKLKRATMKYEAMQLSQYFGEIMRVFDRGAIERWRGCGNSSQVPIFVLGMPRSGTTLTEQIIASHPDVYGGGELPDMQSIAQSDVAGDGAAFPQNMLALDQLGLVYLAQKYITSIQQRAPDARRITDKMPANFFAIGLIHMMLPNAKIIHVKRNPVDTCLSCYTQLFVGNKQSQTYDLAELGQYYADYARLMEHWRNVLPVGAFFDVQYEDIVADQETQARRMIAFCDLDWNDACIDFHKNKRLINTASLAQVRQPIYKSSVERWRPYEKFLGPLLDALGELAVKPS